MSGGQADALKAAASIGIDRFREGDQTQSLRPDKRSKKPLPIGQRFR